MELNGIKTGYWSPNKKEELVQRLAAYENTGLEPGELYGCQGFPDDYIIDHDYSGKSYPRAEQVKRCGNAVCPPIPAAMVRANLPELCVAERTGNIQITQEQTGQLKFA